MNDTQEANAALSSALGTDMTPSPLRAKPTEDFKAPDYSKIKTLPDVLAEKQRVSDYEVQASAELERAKVDKQAEQAREQAKQSRELADNVRTKITETQAKEKEFPYPEFHPTKENAQSLGELFSLVSTMGIMLGSSGKMAAMNSLNAMNGMLSGWQKGRADLFKREKETFDKEFGRIKAIKDELRKDLSDYMAVVPYDKEAAMYKVAEISAKAGTDSVIASLTKQGRAQAAMGVLDSAGKMIQHKEDKEAQERLRMATLAAKQTKETTVLGEPDVNYAFQLGVPVSLQTPYRGLNDKQKAAAFTSELKKAEDEFKADNEATKKARATIDAMTEADALNKKITTGKLARVPGGESVQTMMSSDAARFNSIAQNQARNAYVKGEGALSDFERKMFEKANISLGNPSATNDTIIKVTKEVAARNIEHNDFLQRYFAANKTLFGAEENWTKYIDSNPLFTKDSTSENLVLNPERKPYIQYFQEQLRSQYGR